MFAGTICGLHGSSHELFVLTEYSSIEWWTLNSVFGKFPIKSKLQGWKLKKKLRKVVCINHMRFEPLRTISNQYLIESIGVVSFKKNILTVIIAEPKEN